MKVRKISTPTMSKAGRGGSRDAIVEAAERLFLERGFGSVSMDELAEAAGVARRTLYNQFGSKEESIRPTAAAASISFTVATAHTGCMIPSVSIAFNASVSDRPR